MSIQFEDTRAGLSETLKNIASQLPADTKVTLGTLLRYIGEQGMLVFCLFLTLPFLLPISIPGVSTVFGLVILLIGVGVTFNRIPWLPQRLMNRTVEANDLIPALDKGAAFFARFERFVRPRVLVLTHGATINRFNGLMLVAAAILLMAPLGLIPFSNTLPALAIVCFAIGILERDGIFVLLGHFFNLATVAYFSVLAYLAIVAGQGLTSLIGS